MNEVLAVEYINQGKVLLVSGKSENSLEYFKKAENEDPFNPDIYIGMGIAYTNMEEYGEAEEAFLKAIKVNSKDGKVYFHLGNINLLKGEKVKGIQYYNQAIANGYDDSQIFYNMGILYEEEGDVILALRNYTKAISKAPLRGEIRLKKAMLYIKQKKYYEAVQTLDDMTTECPDNAEGYHMIIRLYSDMKEFDKAHKAVKVAIDNFPEDPDFILDQANLYANQNRFEEALELLKTEGNRTESKIDKRRSAIEHAQIYALQGNMQGTIESLKNAVAASNAKVPPEADPEAEYLLMNCYITMGEYDQALSCARSLKDINTMGDYTLPAYYYEPYCLRMLNRETEADELYRLGIEKLRKYSLQNPNNLDAYVFRMLCLKDLKMYEKALELSDYILKVREDSGELYAIRGAILSEMGREEEAEEEKAKIRTMEGMAALLIQNNQ